MSRIEGGPYNGYRELNCFTIPVSLYACDKLNGTSRDVYGLLKFMAGNSDRVRVKFGEIAKRLSISEDSIARAIDQLYEAGLIQRIRQQHGSLIVFLWSPLLEGSLSKSARAESAEMRTLDNSDHASVRTLDEKSHDQTPQPCGSDSAKMRSAYKEERISFRNKAAAAAADLNETHGAEKTLTEGNASAPEVDPVSGSVVSIGAVRAALKDCGISHSQEGAEEIAAGLVSRGASVEDFEAWLKDRQAGKFPIKRANVVSKALAEGDDFDAWAQRRKRAKPKLAQPNYSNMHDYARRSRLDTHKPSTPQTQYQDAREYLKRRQDSYGEFAKRSNQ